MPKLNLPRADVLDLSGYVVDWKILTLDNYEQVFEEIRKTGRPMTLFALTDGKVEFLRFGKTKKTVNIIAKS